VLTAIYEQDFLPCSYGFRPGLNAHDALDAIGRHDMPRSDSVCSGSRHQRIFYAIVRDQLMAFVERRIGDSSVLRLIRKWIHIGVIEDGRLLVTETGPDKGR